jgi:hypothetical protein
MTKVADHRQRAEAAIRTLEAEAQRRRVLLATPSAKLWKRKRGSCALGDAPGWVLHARPMGAGPPT